MTPINIPPHWDDKLKSIMDWLPEETRDNLLAALGWLNNEEIQKFLEMLKNDKNLREKRNLDESRILIDSVLKYLGEIIGKIETMKKSVDVNLSNNGKIIFINAFKYIRDGVNTSLDDFKEHCGEWRSNKNITSSDIRADIQDILIEGCRKGGWISHLMIFLSYSRSQIIKDKMKEHWIDVPLLESICSNITKMLNEINMEAVVPTVLSDNFDNNLHDYKNGDNWIDKFFNNVSVRDCKRWVIYDITSIGYEIKDEKGNIIRSKKPTVYYI